MPVRVLLTWRSWTVPSIERQHTHHSLLEGAAVERRGGAGVHSPVATWKAHDGAITGLTFYRHLGDTPEQPPIKLATAGERRARQNKRSGGIIAAAQDHIGGQGGDRVVRALPLQAQDYSSCRGAGLRWVAGGREYCCRDINQRICRRLSTCSSVCSLCNGADGRSVGHTGEDKKVLLWDTDKWKLISSIRALPKGNVDALMFSCHGSAAFGEEPCLLLASQVPPDSQHRPPHPTVSQLTSLSGPDLPIGDIHTVLHVRVSTYVSPSH